MHTADIWARLHQTLPSCPTQHKRIKKFPQFKPVPRVIKNEKLPSQQLLGLCMRVCLCVCVQGGGDVFVCLLFIFYFTHFQYIYVFFPCPLTSHWLCNAPKICTPNYQWSKPPILKCQKNGLLVQKPFEGHQQLLLRLLFYS